MTTMNLFQESKDGPRLEIECTFLNLIRHSNKTREEKKPTTNAVMVKCQPLPTDLELTKDGQCNIYPHSSTALGGGGGVGTHSVQTQDEEIS